MKSHLALKKYNPLVAKVGRMSCVVRINKLPSEIGENFGLRFKNSLAKLHGKGKLAKLSWYAGSVLCAQPCFDGPEPPVERARTVVAPV